MKSVSTIRSCVQMLISYRFFIIGPSRVYSLATFCWAENMSSWLSIFFKGVGFVLVAISLPDIGTSSWSFLWKGVEISMSVYGFKPRIS